MTGQVIYCLLLDGIEAESRCTGLLENPLSPLEKLLSHLLVIGVQIIAHQEVVVGVLLVDAFGPVLAVSLNSEDCLRLASGVPVAAAEMIEVPLHRGILVASSGEGESDTVNAAVGQV